MITVTYKAPYELTVAGHATDRNDKGWSLVCACVTALVGGLCEAMAQNQEQTKGCDICIQSGFAHVAVAPNLCFARACEKMFEPTVYGLRHLSQYYPEHIRVIET